MVCDDNRSCAPFEKYYMQRLVSVFFFIALVSCGAKKMVVIPEFSTTFSPELNEISNNEIGISLTSKEKEYTYDAIEITKKFEIKLDNLFKTIEVGQIFINDRSTIKYNLYRNSADSISGVAIPINSKKPLIYIIRENDGIYTTGFSESGINFIEPNEEIEYIQTTAIAKEKDYFKQEFIYNGRVGNALKFIYREYINDYARPAFKQDLQYDLSESEVIGFRGLRIQIISASNTKIEYKVLNYFDK